MNAPSKVKNGCKVISVISCGLKYGPPPADSALLVNCQGFINPYRDEQLRPLTGACPAVAAFLRADPEVQALLKSLPDLIAAILPGYIERSSYHDEVKLVFACTGGKHRSRFFAIAASAIVQDLIDRHPLWDCRVSLNHRDEGRE